MKKLLFTFALIFVQLINSHIVLAELLTPDQIEIKTSLKKMYAIDPDTFEFGRFDAKYKNGEIIVRGKTNSDKQCKLLEDFLVKEAIISVEGVNQGCMTGVHGYFRYPGLDSMDLGAATRTNLPAQPQIKTPKIEGDKAKVYVKIIGAGDAFYYLRKMPEGWRIYKVEARESGENEDHIETGDTVRIFPPPLK